VPYEINFAARPGKTFSQVRRQIFSGRAVKTLPVAAESGIRECLIKMHKN
jgi:hypothetical protein